MTWLQYWRSTSFLLTLALILCGGQSRFDHAVYIVLISWFVLINPTMPKSE